MTEVLSLGPLLTHDILLKKLEHYGVRGNALNWLHSYLAGRAQNVTVNGHVSGSLPISYGVQQGSVLEPLLFLIYVNDDTNIYCHSANLINLQKIVNRELRKVRK